MSSKPSVRIDVVSDVICPWCFLGKRRLDKAVAMLPEATVTIHWLPFFLDPTIPPEGMDRHAYMLNKFGAERLKTIHDPLIAAGKQDGVPYRFEKITRTPNSLNAHRLIRWAGTSQHGVVEALFMAYWNEGRDIGDQQTLVDIAKSRGLDGEQIRASLASDQDKDEVFAEVTQAQSMGIQGVPTFILAQRFGVQGAQSPEMLAQAIQQAMAQQNQI
jgi:predicted DsbA family dithiol-disulfide isomerase